MPIWFTLTRIEFATPSRMPRPRKLVFVTKTSSPTSCVVCPSATVSFYQLAQSPSDIPSSMEMMGNFFCKSA